MQPYAGIPHPDRPGLFVDENAGLLRRYYYIENRLFRLLAGHLPGTPAMNAKHALARHSWEDAQHAKALRERLATLRTPKASIDACPDPALAALMDEAARASTTVELFAGIHGLIKKELLAAYRWHLETTNHIADFPTVRELRIMIDEESAQSEWAQDALAILCTDPAAEEEARAWQAHLRTFLEAAGGVQGLSERRPSANPPRSHEPFRISRHPKRDPEHHVNFQFNEPGDPPPQTVPEKLIFMMRGRLNELAATENPASTLYEMEGQPFEFYWELARHMWDEARHSMLGKAVIEHLGHRTTDWPLRIGPGYSYLSVDPLERYAHLGLNVEQGMMKYPPGKREEFEWCRDVAQNRLAAMYQDYDWADEVYHTQIARRWVGAQLDYNSERMREFARKAGEQMARNTKLIAEAWHAKRAAGGTLGEGDPLPAAPSPTQSGGSPALPNECQTPTATAPTNIDPELTLTKEQIEEDLKRAE